MHERLLFGGIDAVPRIARFELLVYRHEPSTDIAITSLHVKGSKLNCRHNHQQNTQRAGASLAGAKPATAQPAEQSRHQLQQPGKTHGRKRDSKKRSHGARSVVVGVPKAGKELLHRAFAYCVQEPKRPSKHERNGKPKKASVATRVNDAGQNQHRKERLHAGAAGKHERTACDKRLNRRKKRAPGILNHHL